MIDNNKDGIPDRLQVTIQFVFSSALFIVAIYGLTTGKAPQELVWATMTSIVGQWSMSPLSKQ